MLTCALLNISVIKEMLSEVKYTDHRPFRQQINYDTDFHHLKQFDYNHIITESLNVIGM